MVESAAHKLARADFLERWADAMENKVSAARREIRQIRARHQNHAAIAALNRALDGSGA